MSYITFEDRLWIWQRHRALGNQGYCARARAARRRMGRWRCATVGSGSRPLASSIRCQSLYWICS